MIGGVFGPTVDAFVWSVGPSLTTAAVWIALAVAALRRRGRVAGVWPIAAGSGLLAWCFLFYATSGVLQILNSGADLWRILEYPVYQSLSALTNLASVAGPGLMLFGVVRLLRARDRAGGWDRP